MPNATLTTPLLVHSPLSLPVGSRAGAQAGSYAAVEVALASRSPARMLVEHCSQNAMITGHLNGVVTKNSTALTVGERLTSLMLSDCVAYVIALEWRVVGGAFAPKASFPLPPAEAQRRSQLLAVAQATAQVTMSRARAGGAA